MENRISQQTFSYIELLLQYFIVRIFTGNSSISQ